MTNVPQLFLLADHIKLMLLESSTADATSPRPRQTRAAVSKSLESLQRGVAELELQARADVNIHSQLKDLRKRYEEMLRLNEIETTQGDSQDHPAKDHTAVMMSRAPEAGELHSAAKNVRFTDDPTNPSNLEVGLNSRSLFPYHDDPDEPQKADPSDWDNQRIHEYHQEVLRDQDQHIDRLGASIGRQRELSIQIGDELYDQDEVLDHIDAQVHRHQTQLDRAKSRLGTLARKAKDNLSVTVIAVLVLILVLLLTLFK